jgi:serine phosphatase RsbU (regulator of sigma subunit)
MTGGAPGSAPRVESPAQIAAVLARHPTFARFDRESLLAVAACCRFATYPAGEVIMREGDPGSFACLIVEGEVEVFKDLSIGRVCVARIGADQIIGELGVFSDQPRSATIVARGELTVARIEQSSLIALCAEYPPLAVGIIRDLGGRLARMNRALGFLTSAAEALRRDQYDPALLAELTGQPGELATFAQAFADMAGELRAKQNRRQEMHAAAEIQLSILPPRFRRDGVAARIDLHAEMHPAREIGGDFYDHYMLDATRLAFTVGDVSGKGIPAALFMAVSRTVMRSVGGAADMASAMEAANRLLATQNAACMFVTLFHGVLDLATGALRYCNAGHNPPYLLRADGRREKLGATGVPFGFDPEMTYHTEETALRAGDLLFLFSDGITEAFDCDGREFGTGRLEAALEAGRGKGAGEVVAAVLAATRDFAAGAEQSDDITTLALLYRP